MKKKNKLTTKTKILSLDSKFDILSHKTIENGYLELKCRFARTGIQERIGLEIHKELEPYAVFKEYRSYEEVCKSSVLEAFKKVVITNEHPNVALNEENTKDHMVGYVSSDVTIEEVDHEGTKEYALACTIIIIDSQTIQDIKDGKIELSASYLYDLEVTPNNPHYDYMQKNLIPNHIAIVQAGRCGQACSIAFDNAKPNSKERKEMKVTFYRHLPNGEKEVVFEIDISNEEEAKALQVFADSYYKKSKEHVEVSAAKDEEIQEAKDNVEKKDEQLEAKDSKISQLQAKIDMQKPQANDCAVKKLALDMSSTLVAAANVLSVEASTLLANDKDPQEQITDIKKQVITKYRPNIALDDKSSTYIDAAYDTVLDDLSNADDSYLLSLKALDHKKPTDEQKKKADDTKTNFNKKYFGGDE